MAEAKPLSLKIHLKNKDALYRAYMPFVGNGGLFVPSQKTLSLGTPIQLEFRLLDDDESFQIQTTVVWTTPVSADGRWKPGFGVEFDNQQGSKARAKIETLLAGSLESDAPTNTM